MRRLIFLSILIIAPASEVFAARSPLCSEILDWHESENRAEKNVVRESVVMFFNGYLNGFRDNPSEHNPPEELWDLPDSAYYRLVIRECEQNPADLLPTAVAKILIQFKEKEYINQ